MKAHPGCTNTTVIVYTNVHYNRQAELVILLAVTQLANEHTGLIIRGIPYFKDWHLN